MPPSKFIRVEHKLALHALLWFGLLIFLSSVQLARGSEAGDPPSYPELNAPTGLKDPSLAFGLAGINDWHPGLPFLDIMKMSRAWLGHLPDQWGGMTEAEIRDGGYLDRNGWPTAIPPELESIGTIFAWGNNAYGQGEVQEGRYELSYEGEGDLRLLLIAKNQIISQKPGRILFSIRKDQSNWGFKIYSTDPDKNGNYIRHVKIVRENRVDLFDAGAIFNPDWLALIQDARQIRYMDFVNTNGSDVSNWSEQRKLDDYTWSENVPLEVQVRLANLIGADPWFNLPFHANDDYIEQFAIFVRENLDPNLVAHVELSNEVWNWSFQQAQDAQKLAISAWELDPNNAGAGWVNYYGMRASQVMRIWTRVFGDETNIRLKRVAGTQTANAWLSQQILDAPLWAENDPDNYLPPYKVFDALSVTTYFGGGAIQNEEYRDALLTALEAPEINNYDFHYRLIKGEIQGLKGQFQETINALQSQREVADEYDLEMIGYEGGQHVHHSAFIDIPEADLLRLQDHLTGFVRSQQMADLYQELWDEWKRLGSGPFMQFIEIGAPSKWGSWGLRASLTDNPVRAILLGRLNRETPAWWESRGGNHFQQGVTTYGTDGNDVITGTQAEDFLIGQNGDDIFYPGSGNDGINGGAGNDTVLLKGEQSDYEIVVKNDGYRVAGPDGRDYVYAVEVLQFSDMQMKLDTLPK